MALGKACLMGALAWLLEDCFSGGVLLWMLILKLGELAVRDGQVVPADDSDHSWREDSGASWSSCPHYRGPTSGLAVRYWVCSQPTCGAWEWACYAGSVCALCGGAWHQWD